jgi:DNA-binding NarL/FixJ family response regulator
MQMRPRRFIEVTNGPTSFGISLPELSSALERVALLGSGNWGKVVCLGLFLKAGLSKLSPPSPATDVLTEIPVRGSPVATRKNVLIWCSNRLLRESVARIIGKKTDFQVAFSPAGTETSDRVRREIAEKSANVIVVDSLQFLPETSCSGGSRPRNYLLVAMEDDQRSFLTAIRRGALGYVLQDASALEVVNAIRSVAQGEGVCPPRYVKLLYDYFMMRTAGSPNRHVRSQLGLTRREQQLIPLIERGMTNKEIANHLNLSEQTVKNHVHRILQKVGVGDRLSVVEAVQTQSLGV